MTTNPQPDTLLSPWGTPWLCSQHDHALAVGGAYNLHGEPIPMCQEHLDDCDSGHLTLAEFDKEYRDVYGIDDPA